MLRQDDGLRQPDVRPVRRDRRQWLVEGLPSHVIPQDDEERLRSTELLRAGIDARQRLRRQGLLAVEDRAPFDRPIDDLPRRSPRLNARE